MGQNEKPGDAGRRTPGIQQHSTLDSTVVVHIAQCDNARSLCPATCGWREELDWLAVRYAHLGISSDLAALTYVEGYALLSWLRTLEATT